MLYIFGTYLNGNKTIINALKNIYGISTQKSLVICNKIGIGKKEKISNLSNTNIYYLKNIIKKYFLITNELRRIISLNIKKHIELHNYKGMRHKLAYPVRGQRTHTNAKTQKKLAKTRVSIKN